MRLRFDVEDLLAHFDDLATEPAVSRVTIRKASSCILGQPGEGAGHLEGFPGRLPRFRV